MAFNPNHEDYPSALNPIQYLESLGVPLENEHFVIFHNEEENAYDLVFQQEGYAMNEMFLDVLGLIHQIGRACPDVLRIGAVVKEKSKVIVKKPKIYLQ